MKKRILSMLLTLCIVLTLIIAMPLSVSAVTQTDAVNWLKAQGGAWYNLDNAHGAQCSDFASAYMNWLITGNPYGGPYDVYYAYYYPTVASWDTSKWQVIEYYAGFVPQPGDIFVSSGTDASEHVGVVIWSDAYNATVVDQNFWLREPSPEELENGCEAKIHDIVWFDWSTYRPSHFIRFKGFSGTSQPHTHTFGNWTVSVKATCTRNGTEVRKCSSCTKTETRTIYATGHNYIGVETKPTCQSEGYTTYTCSYCYDSYTGNYTWTDHDYISIETKPTCHSDGYVSYTCSMCSYSYNEYTDSKIEHDFVDGVCTFCGVNLLSVPWEQSSVGFQGVDSENFVKYENKEFETFELITGQVFEWYEGGAVLDSKVWTILESGEVFEFSWEDLFGEELLNSCLSKGLCADGSNLTIAIEELCDEEKAVIRIEYLDNEDNLTTLFFSSTDGKNFHLEATQPDNDIVPDFDSEKFINADYDKIEIECYNGIYVLACSTIYDYGYDYEIIDYYLTKTFDYNLDNWLFLGDEYPEGDSWSYDFYAGEKGLYIYETFNGISYNFKRSVIYTNDAKNFICIGRNAKEASYDETFFSHISTDGSKAYIFEADADSEDMANNKEAYYACRLIEFDEETMQPVTIYDDNTLSYNYHFRYYPYTKTYALMMDNQNKDVIYISVENETFTKGNAAFNPIDISWWLALHTWNYNFDLVNDNELYFSNDYYESTYKIALPKRDGFYSVHFDKLNLGYIYLLGKDSYRLNVKPISLNKTEMLLDKGDKETLIASLFPCDGIDKNITWSSSDKTVATVENGVVSGISEGTAVITVMTEDGSYTATCSVTVSITSPEITTFTVNKNGITATVNLNVTNVPTESIIYVATYAEGGKLLEVKTLTLIEGCSAEETFSTKDVDKYKAFIWDMNMKPLCDPKEY